jgi:hypothetical protein
MEIVMNFSSSQLAILRPSPSTGPGLTSSGDGLRLRALRTMWRDYETRRREARAFDAIGDMNEHILRDIGAPDRLVANAAARKAAHDRRRFPVQLSVSVLAAALIANAMPTLAAEATKAYAQGQTVGVFTGEFVDGAPVYRLPPMVIVGARKVERAKMDRDEQSTRAKQARAKAAAKHPA